jgi:predicted dehydrogenase
MTTPVRIGLVGAGAIAQAYAQAIRQTDAVELCGVVDVRLPAARALAEGSNCPAYENIDPLLDKERCQAMIVCTPPDSHAALCRRLLEAHVAVLCEKPLCVHSAEAQSLAELAKRQNCVFTMATKFRFVEDVVAARSMVTSGVVGDVLLFENAFTSRVDMSHRWNSQPKMSGGGVLIDNGTHSVDLVRYFLGPIVAVQAFEGRRTQGLEVEDNAQLWLRTHDQVLSTIDLSWSLNKDLESFIQIYGSQGTIRVGWKKSVYKQISSSEWVTFGMGYDKVRAFCNQIRNFCDAVRGVAAPLVTPDDALASVRVIEAAYQSMNQSKWVGVLNGSPS